MKRKRKQDKGLSTMASADAVVKNHKKVAGWQFVTGVLAAVVLLCAVYPMILPALTMEQKTYCGKEEHQHTAECYEQRLTCGQEETEAHTHSEECYEETLVCEKEEHVHEALCQEAPQEDPAEPEDQPMTLAAASDTRANSSYVGYSKRASDMSSFEFAYLPGGVGPRKFYLASEATYNQYTNLAKTYANQAKLIAQSELAYCFNYYKDPPEASYNEYKSYYLEKENASASLFYNATSSHVRIKNANQLYQKILSVALNGYPNDYSGLKAKYGLTDDVFRAITQYAIWYYTDNISIKLYESTNYYMYADDTNTWLTKKNGVNTAIPFTNFNWWNAYNDLLNSSLDSSTLNTSHINLYKNSTGAYQHLLTVGQEDAPPSQPPTPTPTSVEAKVQIPVKKTIDGGATDIGEHRFQFRLTGNGVDLTATSDENGEALFPEIIYTKAGTYTYTVEEVSDERDGVSFDFDKSKKTITVKVSSHDLQTYDETAKYYAFEEMDDNYEYYYYVDTVPGQKGIVMYCTYQSISGPQSTTTVPAKNQTYRAVINPTVAEIEANHWVENNLYGDQLNEKLKKLFYYFETDEGKQLANSDKQSLVWTATGKTSKISSIKVGNLPASSNATTVLNNIYSTITPPPYYNLAFFIPTGTQALDPSQGGHPQPLATGYGAVVETTSDGAVFDNTTKAQNSLKLTKTVSGSAGDQEQLFQFAILLRNQYLSSLSGTFPVTPGAIDGVEVPAITQITFTGGYAEVKLKHGQNITITGLPDGFYYSVNEMDAGDYTVSTTGDPNANWTARQGATGTVDVTFNNYKETPPPTPSYEAEIKVNKTLDGKAPGDKKFTFILRNAQGEEIARKQNDENGEVIFPLTITEAGTFTYTVEELNDGQPGIVYDTAKKTVTVTVTSQMLEEIVSGERFVGSGTQGNFKITVDGTRALDVYCIDGSVGNPSGTYDKVLNPTTAQLEQQVTANPYGSALANNMKKLLYYFDTHSYTDSVTGPQGYSMTLSKANRQELIWCLTGNPGQQHVSYQDPLNKILTESNPPNDYTVVMFASNGTPKAQPVIAGYRPTMTVQYEGEAGNVEFANHYEYVLPETGGEGTKAYVMGGLLLMSGAVLLLWKNKLGRKKEGE